MLCTFMCSLFLFLFSFFLLLSIPPSTSSPLSLFLLFSPTSLLLTPSLATLKGSTLLLYQCDDITNLSESAHVDLRLGKPTL